MKHHQLQLMLAMMISVILVRLHLLVLVLELVLLYLLHLLWIRDHELSVVGEATTSFMEPGGSSSAVGPASVTVRGSS